MTSNLIYNSGFIASGPPPRNTLPEKIFNAIRLFTNLRGVKFTPSSDNEKLFVSILPLLCDLSALRDVEVNCSCSNELRAPMLVKLENLRKVSLINPGRTILELLPNWLARLSRTLVELHLKVKQLYSCFW